MPLRLLCRQQQEDHQRGAAGNAAQQQVVASPPRSGHNARPANSSGNQAEMAWKRSGVRRDMAAAQVATHVPVQQREHDRHHQQQAQRTHLVVEQGQAGAEAGQQPGQDALRRAGNVFGAQCCPQHHGNQHGGSTNR
jgi:hypothetical protein